MTTRFAIPGNRFEWVDICEPSARELEELAHTYGLHPYTVRDCLEPDHLPKFEALADGVSFIIFRRYSPKSETESHTTQDLTTKVALFFKDKFLITIHRKPAPFLQDLHKHFVETKRTDEVREIVTKVLWYVLHSYEAPAREMSDLVDDFESTIFLRNSPKNLEQRLYFLKRKATVARHVLDQTADVIFKITTSVEDAPSLQDARDLHIKLHSIYVQIRDDVTTLLNTHLSLAAQRTNEVMRILTIFSVFFMPLTFIAGIYGMNFDVMPELRHPHGYFICLGSMLVVTVFIYFWFKRKHWL